MTKEVKTGMMAFIILVVAMAVFLFCPSERLVWRELFPHDSILFQCTGDQKRK